MTPTQTAELIDTLKHCVECYEGEDDIEVLMSVDIILKIYKIALQAPQPEEITSIHDLGELIQDSCLDFSERVLLKEDQGRYIAKEILKRYPHGFKITGDK